MISFNLDILYLNLSVLRLNNFILIFPLTIDEPWLNHHSPGVGAMGLPWPSMNCNGVSLRKILLCTLQFRLRTFRLHFLDYFISLLLILLKNKINWDILSVQFLMRDGQMESWNTKLRLWPTSFEASKLNGTIFCRVYSSRYLLWAAGWIIPSPSLLVVTKMPFITSFVIN